MVSTALAQEQIWFDKYRTEDAETAYYERKSGCCVGGQAAPESVGSSLVNEIARARQQIKNALNKEVDAPASSGGGDGLLKKIQALEKENQELKQVTQSLAAVCKQLESRISALEKAGSTNNHTKPAAQAPAAPPKKEEKAEEEDEEDDDFELFGSDDEDDEEAEKLKQERVAAYAAKKSKKPAVIAKSSLLIDVKPWDDETDMAEMEKCVRSIEMDGLVWGASKLVPVGYGIKKLVINCVVEDDKVSTDDLEEKIVEFEDYVQSMDIAAFNKI